MNTRSSTEEVRDSRSFCERQLSCAQQMVRNSVVGRIASILTSRKRSQFNESSQFAESELRRAAQFGEVAAANTRLPHRLPPPVLLFLRLGRCGAGNDCLWAALAGFHTWTVGRLLRCGTILLRAMERRPLVELAEDHLASGRLKH